MNKFAITSSRFALALLWAGPCTISTSVGCAQTTESVLTTNPAAAFQLRPNIQVDGRGVFLDQLSVRPQDLPRVRLCDSPAFDKALILKQADISELARAAGYQPVLTNWTGATAVHVSRRSRLLQEREALQLLTSVLQKEYVKDEGELELRFSRPWTSASVPDEPFTIKVLDVPTSGVAPSFIARFELETGAGEHIGSWQASVQAKVWHQVWVAGSALKRGEVLQGADLNRERRDMLVCREPLANIEAGDQSLEFNQPVPAGAPILARMLRPRVIVHRGQSLAATVQDGAMRITLKVEALEDGAAGQIIRVRNPQTFRDLRGKVLDEQEIRVTL